MLYHFVVGRYGHIRVEQRYAVACKCQQTISCLDNQVNLILTLIGPVVHFLTSTKPVMRMRLNNPAMGTSHMTTTITKTTSTMTAKTITKEIVILWKRVMDQWKTCWKAGKSQYLRMQCPLEKTKKQLAISIYNWRKQWHTGGYIGTSKIWRGTYQERGCAACRKVATQLSHILQTYHEKLGSDLLGLDVVTESPGAFCIAQAPDFHALKLLDEYTMYFEPWRLRVLLQNVVQKEYPDVLNGSINTPATSAWEFPIAVVNRKGVNPGLCINDQPLDRRMKLKHFPLSTVEEVLENVNVCSYFRTLAIFSVYWQIPVAKNWKIHYSFTCNSGLFGVRSCNLG